MFGRFILSFPCHAMPCHSLPTPKVLKRTKKRFLSKAKGNMRICLKYKKHKKSECFQRYIWEYIFSVTRKNLTSAIMRNSWHQNYALSLGQTAGATEDCMDASTPSYRKGEHKLSIFLQHWGHQRDHCRLYGDYHQSISWKETKWS